MADKELQGRIAIVTGAAQGIGRAVMKRLAEMGATVLGVDRNEPLLREVVTNQQQLGYKVKAWPLDVADSHSVEKFFDEIEGVLGPVEILVNVAGILITGPIKSINPEDWEKIFAVNSTGVFNMSRNAARCMAVRRSGAIVTVSSNAAETPRMYMSAYAASKAAATMFTKCLGLEYAQYNIRCNIVSPGSTDTPMLRAMWSDEKGMEHVIAGTPEEYRLGIPLRKLARPDEVADSVAFLVSDRSSHITMQDLIVDGGSILGSR